jgi:hypothetical protein
MTTQKSSTSKKITPRKASTPRKTPIPGVPSLPSAAKPVTGEYVHFSDKMTGALRNINNVIEDNRGTLDSIQDMAVQLTRTIISLRLIVMKYVDTAEKVLETIIPVMEKLPIIPDKVMDFARDAQEWAEKISNASDLVEKVLPGVERSLTTADISGLQTSAGDVANLTRALQEMIPVGDDK